MDHYIASYTSECCYFIMTIGQGRLKRLNTKMLLSWDALFLLYKGNSLSLQKQYSSIGTTFPCISSHIRPHALT